MSPEKFKERTKRFALRVIRLVEALPRDGAGGVIRRQILRSGTSVGANYRAACRARSRAEFAAKLGLVESNLMPRDRVADLTEEANEILALVVASIRTARRQSASG